MGILDRLKMCLDGYVYVGDKQEEGWKTPIPHYAFKCPKHGIVCNYPHGYNQKLECPLCVKERLEKLDEV